MSHVNLESSVASANFVQCAIIQLHPIVVQCRIIHLYWKYTGTMALEQCLLFHDHDNRSHVDL